MNPESSKTVRASLLSIGDELLLGEIVDTNMPYISQHLLALNISVAGSETLGDEIDEIAAAFQRALSRSEIVIATGGLGPTDDDLTMDAVAKALGVKTEFRAEVMEQMAARLKRPVSAFSESNRKQAFLPQGAEILRNDWGTAPGVHVKTQGRHIFLMPGVPREMKGLLGERILPILRENFPSHRVLVVKRLHAYGIGESAIGERIKPLMQAGLNPNVGTRVSGGVCAVRLVASGATKQEAEIILAPAVEQVRQAISEGLFGEDDDTLASATLKTLISRKKTVACAESCTAGLVTSLLAEVPGASTALLEGAVVYSNAAKMRCCGVKNETLNAHGAVSTQTAQELAEGIRTRSGSDIGLSVTGVAGPGGGSEAKPVGLVYFGISTKAGCKTVERHYTGMDRNIIRERAAMQALDLIRRAGLEAP